MHRTDRHVLGLRDRTNHRGKRMNRRFKLAKGSPERFGYSWDDYADLLPEHEEQFLRWTALDQSSWRASLRRWRLRHWPQCYRPMPYGAIGGLPSTSTIGRSAARAQPRAVPGVEVRKQSIYDIAKPDVFDIASASAWCTTWDPDAASRGSRARQNRAGRCWSGCTDGRTTAGWCTFPPLRRALFSRLPLRLVHALSWPLTALLWCALRLGVPRGAYYRLIRGFSFAHLRAIVFDHMIRASHSLHARAGRGAACAGRSYRYPLHLGERKLLVRHRSQAGKAMTKELPNRIGPYSKGSHCRFPSAPAKASQVKSSSSSNRGITASLAAPIGRWWGEHGGLASSLVYAAVAALLAIPVLIANVPLGADTLGHLARIYVRAHIGSDPNLARLLEVRTDIIPYLGMDLLLTPFTRLLPIMLVGRAYILALVWGLVGAGVVLQRVFTSRIGLGPAVTGLIA